MLGPRLVHRALAFWMQTMGATLLTVRWGSLACMWMLAHGSRSAHGLLYFAAVRVRPATWVVRSEWYAPGFRSSR